MHVYAYFRSKSHSIAFTIQGFNYTVYEKKSITCGLYAGISVIPSLRVVKFPNIFLLLCKEPS